jgi:hypothetical protein
MKTWSPAFTFRSSTSIPAIWRRIEVPADFTLKTLHDALQRAMGSFDGYLHHFEIGGIHLIDVESSSPTDRGSTIIFRAATKIAKKYGVLESLKQRLARDK